MKLAEAVAVRLSAQREVDRDGADEGQEQSKGSKGAPFRGGDGDQGDADCELRQRQEDPEGGGDPAKAIPVLEQGLSLCEVGNIATFFLLIAAPLGYAYTLSGRVAEALPLLHPVRLARASFNGEFSVTVLWDVAYTLGMSLLLLLWARRGVRDRLTN